MTIAAGFAALGLSQAGAVPMSFDNPVQSTNGNDSNVGNLIAQPAVEFLGVATDDGRTVDLRITSTKKVDTEFGERTGGFFGFGTQDSGYVPDYVNGGGAGGPQQDLGTLYYGTDVNSLENGITLTFQFFDGTGAQSGTFANGLNVSELEFAIYDIDGDSGQSEFMRAFTADGLVSYRVGDTPQAVTASEESAGVLRFDGIGSNVDEEDASGALILKYAYVQSLTLDFGSVQSGGADDNGVFNGFDGDLSLFDIDDFKPEIPLAPVPLPAGALLMLGALGGLAAARRKRG